MLGKFTHLRCVSINIEKNPSEISRIELLADERKIGVGGNSWGISGVPTISQCVINPSEKSKKDQKKDLDGLSLGRYEGKPS